MQIIFLTKDRNGMEEGNKQEEDKAMYWVVSKALSVLMSYVFVAPYLNKYLFYCVVVYTDRWRILYSIH